MNFHLELSGDPIGKGRPRFTREGIAFTPEKTRKFEAYIRLGAQERMADQPPADCPVRLRIAAIFAPPASWSRKKRLKALMGEILPAKRPDIDNITKAVQDALNGIVYRDDALIVESFTQKQYGETAGLRISVEPLDGVGRG